MQLRLGHGTEAANKKIFVTHHELVRVVSREKLCLRGAVRNSFLLWGVETFATSCLDAQDHVIDCNESRRTFIFSVGEEEELEYSGTIKMV